ncbi:MAG: ATP-binding protein [Ignisphaera sp.]
MALFDVRPKSRREELFDRERELGELGSAVSRGHPLILLLGVRRIGKTSILRTFLSTVNGIYVDMRGVVRRQDLEARVADYVSEHLDRFRRFLSGVRGVSIAGLSIEIRWRGRDSISFLGLLEELNKRGERFAIVLDEVQHARPPLSAELRNAIAYAYDNLENITFIIAGSEIGMVRDFLRLDDPSSPLYGRHVHEIAVERFSRDLSREFLYRGFREEGVEPPKEAIEEAINFFDGIVGWLVLFGRSYVDGARDFSYIKRLAIETALQELNKLTNREKAVLKAVTHGCRNWSCIRDFIAEQHGILLPKSTLSRTIDKLEKLSIIKDYTFLDPVYKEASKNLHTTPT